MRRPSLYEYFDSHTWVDGLNEQQIHDRVHLADIVAEWAALHGEPFELVRDGPAGRTFSQGRGGEQVGIDATDFVRTLAGRQQGRGVLGHPLPL